MMLDAMELESENWPSFGNLNQVITEKVILPSTILATSDYYAKLQRLAFYSERGDVA